MFLSTYLALMPIENIKTENDKNEYDGVSAIFALILMCVIMPILLHQSFIIFYYQQYLEDEDTK
jgi:hypothetical protein